MEAITFESFAIGVRISLLGNITAGLMGMSRLFGKVHGDAVGLQRQLDRIKLTALTGAAMAGTGAFGLSLVAKTIPAAREYAHQLQQMNVAGMKQAEIAQAVAAAWGAAGKVPTATATENLAAIRELRMVFGDSRAAIANMPAVQQIQAILANTKGESGGRDEAYTVAKALEMKGAVRTPGEFQTQADAMAKAIIASGGKVGAQDFLSAFKYGRSATLGWNDQFTYTILPTLIQEMKTSGGSGGAGGPGNALMSAYAAVVGGTVPQKALKEWSKLGLLDSSKVVYDKVGSAKGLRPGGIEGWQTFQQNPYQWAQQILLPALTKAGMTDPAKQRQELQYLFPNRTAGFAMQQLVTQGWKFQRDQRLIQGAQGLGAYQTLLKRDPFMAEMAMRAQMNNLMTRLGIAILPVLLSTLNTLVPLVERFTAILGQHPKLTAALVIGFTALSGALLFGGTVLLLSAAFSGLKLALPVVGVVGAALPALGQGLLAIGAAIVGAVGWPVLAIVAGVTALGIGLFELYRHFAPFRTWVDGVAHYWKDVFIGLWVTTKPVLLGAWNAIKAAWNFLWHAFVASQAPLVASLTAIRSALTGFFSFLGGIKLPPTIAGGAGNVAKHALLSVIPGGEAAAALIKGLHDKGAAAERPIKKASYEAQTGSRYIAPGQGKVIQVSQSINLDGHQIAKTVTRHQVSDMSRQPNGPSGFDPSLALTPVGAGYQT